MKKLSISLILIAFFSMTVWADIAPGKQATPNPTPKGKQMEMFIEVSSDVTEPTLIIKKSSTKMLRAALDEAEGVEDSNAYVEAQPDSGKTQTLIGGMFLSMALVFGGVWLVRSKPSKTVIGLFFVTILGSATILVTANVAPPRNFKINENLFNTSFKGRAFARDKVRIKIVNDSIGSDFQLLVPSVEDSSKGE